MSFSEPPEVWGICCTWQLSSTICCWLNCKISVHVCLKWL